MPPFLIVLELQVPVLASPFSCIVWEGTACVIAQDVVNNDIRVRFRSGPGHPAIRS